MSARLSLCTYVPCVPCTACSRRTSRVVWRGFHLILPSLLRRAVSNRGSPTTRHQTPKITQTSRTVVYLGVVSQCVGLHSVTSSVQASYKHDWNSWAASRIPFRLHFVFRLVVVAPPLHPPTTPPVTQGVTLCATSTYPLLAPVSLPSPRRQTLNIKRRPMRRSWRNPPLPPTARHDPSTKCTPHIHTQRHTDLPQFNCWNTLQTLLRISAS